MKKRYKIPLALTGIFIFAICFALIFLPWKLAVEGQLQKILNEKGFENVELKLSGLGLHEAKLQDITIGHDKNIALKNLDLRYSLDKLWQGNLREIEVSGLTLQMRQVDDKWVLQGYRAKAESKGSSLLPVTIPFDDIAIKESQLNILSDKWNILVPFQAQFHKNPASVISLTSANPQFATASMKMGAANADIQLAFDRSKQNWQGIWKFQDIALSRTIPLLQADGTLVLDEKNSLLSGKIQSPDNIYSAQFHAAFPASILTIERAVMLWKGGTVSVKNAEIKLNDDAPIAITVQLDKISVDELMQAMTGKRVSATGLVSGNLPVHIARDGKISFGQGNLHSTQPGTITMPEDAIPGDNPQIQLTRDILKNFHYSNLSVTVKNAKDGTLIVGLALEGNNPDMYAGRPVKLNVNLSGDVLDFIKQNAILMKDPQTMLQQGDQ